MYQFKHLGFLLFCIRLLLWKWYWISSSFKPIYKYMYIYVNVYACIKEIVIVANSPCRQCGRTTQAKCTGGTKESSQTLSSAKQKFCHNEALPWKHNTMDSILENPLGLIHPDSSELPVRKHVDKHPAFPTDGVKLSIICQGKKNRDKLQGFSRTMSSELSNCSMPRSLFWPRWPCALTLKRLWC